MADNGVETGSNGEVEPATTGRKEGLSLRVPGLAEIVVKARKKDHELARELFEVPSPERPG